MRYDETLNKAILSLSPVARGGSRGEGRPRLTRRGFVQAGCLTAWGLGVGDWLRLRAVASPIQHDRPRATACIVVWLDGGPSHIDLWDPKPDAPVEVRGPFQSINTAIAGVQYSELLPNLARLATRSALIRSVTSPLGEHNFGAHYLLTGFRSTPVLEYPAVGCVVGRLRESKSVLPAHVAVPDFWIGGGKFSGQGFLPPEAKPFSLGSDPAKPGFRVRDLDPFPAVDVDRLERRRRFLTQLDQNSDVPPATGLDPLYDQAFRMTLSTDVAEAFQLDREPADLRARYGPRTIGQGCLVARRLIERGVPFVTVNNPGWDTHQNQITQLKEGYTGAKVPVGLAPSMDLAVSALIEDLERSGRLESTLVIVMGEFGRTPKINAMAGRDHWPRVFSVWMAGGGIRGGVVHGSSDFVGEGPKDRPVTPADLTATVYQLLGIDPSTTLMTRDGRPIRLSEGNPIRDIVT